MRSTYQGRVCRMSMVGLVLLLLGACSAKHKEPNLELIQDMRDQPALKEQDYDPSHPHGLAMRTPPAGTIPQGYSPYRYKNDPGLAEKELKNPLASDKAVLERGRDRFEIYCGVCHGEQGRGDGPVAPRMALKPPPLISDKVRNYKDGRIYHIITAGQGVMGSYATQIPNSRDRWAIVNYVRELQRTQKSAGP